MGAPKGRKYASHGESGLIPPSPLRAPGLSSADSDPRRLPTVALTGTQVPGRPVPDGPEPMQLIAPGISMGLRVSSGRGPSPNLNTRFGGPLGPGRPPRASPGPGRGLRVRVQKEAPASSTDMTTPGPTRPPRPQSLPEPGSPAGPPGRLAATAADLPTSRCRVYTADVQASRC